MPWFQISKKIKATALVEADSLSEARAITEKGLDLDYDPDVWDVSIENHAQGDNGGAFF